MYNNELKDIVIPMLRVFGSTIKMKKMCVKKLQEASCCYNLYVYKGMLDINNISEVIDGIDEHYKQIKFYKDIIKYLNKNQKRLDNYILNEFIKLDREIVKLLYKSGINSISELKLLYENKLNAEKNKVYYNSLGYMGITQINIANMKYYIDIISKITRYGCYINKEFKGIANKIILDNMMKKYKCSSIDELKTVCVERLSKITQTVLSNKFKLFHEDSTGYTYTSQLYEIGESDESLEEMQYIIKKIHDISNHID